MVCCGHWVEGHLLGNLAHTPLEFTHPVLHDQNYCLSDTVQSTDVYANEDGAVGENGHPEQKPTVGR